MTELETRRALRALTYGYQDIAISNTSSSPKYIRVVKHESFSLGGRDGNLVKHLINHCRSGYGLANIRLDGRAWRDAKLFTTASQVISSLSSPKYGHSFFLTDEGNYLPFVGFHGFEIHFTCVGEETVNLAYDIVECAPPRGYFAIVFKSYTSKEIRHADTGNQRVRLSFVNPVEKILLHFEKDPDIVPSFFCKVGDKEFTLPFRKVSEDTSSQYVLDFENETVNFSNLASAEVLVETMENSMEICCIALNILRSASDMYGLAFAPS